MLLCPFLGGSGTKNSASQRHITVGLMPRSLAAPPGWHAMPPPLHASDFNGYFLHLDTLHYEGNHLLDGAKAPQGTTSASLLPRHSFRSCQPLKGSVHRTLGDRSEIAATRLNLSNYLRSVRAIAPCSPSHWNSVCQHVRERPQCVGR